MPAGDVDFLDEQAQQSLFLGEVEGVDHVQDPAGEVTDAVAQLVVAGELVALRGEGVASLVQVAAAVLDVGGALVCVGPRLPRFPPGGDRPASRSATQPCAHDQPAEAVATGVHREPS